MARTAELWQQLSFKVPLLGAEPAPFVLIQLCARRHQMAPLVGIATNLRAVLAPHVPFQFMDRRCLRSAHDIEGNGLVRVAAKAFHFEIAKQVRKAPGTARGSVPGVRSSRSRDNAGGKRC